nr:hypothetical protein [Ruegeria sp. PR1b]
MDNLDFGLTAEVNHTLAVLRAMSFEGRLEADQRFVPGMYLSMDPAGDSKATLSSRPGALMDLAVTTRRAGGWLSLNMELGAFDLSRHSVLGVMCKSAAPQTLTFKVCLRSGVGDGFVDAFFQKRVISYEKESVHADLIKLAERDDVPPEAPWRELILFFPPELEKISLHDFALFGV